MSQIFNNKFLQSSKQKMSVNLCIYIPRMSSFVTDVIIKEQLSFIGKIKRIDFTPINKRPGFYEGTNNNFKSAFVHFYYMTPYYEDYFSKGEPYKFQPQFVSSEFWILLKAKNPTQETMMNKSQIVENCRFLEKKVEEQAQTIKTLENKVQGIHQVVYDLLCGLFNQDTQRATLTNHLKELFPNIDEKLSYENPDTSEWSIYPTTRQGDNNERRIIDLEEQVKWIQENDYMDEEAVFKPYEELYEEDENSMLKDISSENNDDITVSSHSSMPYLIEYNDNDEDNDINENINNNNEDDSIPELESITSSDLSTRIRNSFQLFNYT